MTNAYRAATMLLAVGFATLLPIGLAVAETKPATRPDDVRYREHRRLTEEGEKASRARPPSPPRAVPLDDGIEQIPIDTSKRSGNFKEDARAPGRADAQLRAAGAAPPACPYNPYANPRMKVGSFLKAFPEVSWHVCVRDMGLKSLWVGPVHLKRSPTGPWIQVLYQAGLADIFVPYHQTNFRPYDLRWTSQLPQVTAQDAGMNGTVWYLTHENVPTVVTELRERGIGWLCKQTTVATRRAQEFVVWGVADGGNYDNIVQYSFRDDGGMSFRMGNTGFNASRPPTTNPTSIEPHTHTALWRIDMDLNGASQNSAYWLYHREPNPLGSPLKANDHKVPFNVEGMRQWNPLQFTSLLIEDAQANEHGNKWGYEFVPVQSGISRHYGPREQWTRNDVYVTRYDVAELAWVTIWDDPDNYLLQTIDGESVNNNDLVVWIKSSAHHHPNDEDKSAADLGRPTASGVTLTHWSGFDIDPHNLFDANPLGAPERCYVP